MACKLATHIDERRISSRWIVYIWNVVYAPLSIFSFFIMKFGETKRMRCPHLEWLKCNEENKKCWKTDEMWLHKATHNIFNAKPVWGIGWCSDSSNTFTTSCIGMFDRIFWLVCKCHTYPSSCFHSFVFIFLSFNLRYSWYTLVILVDRSLLTPWLLFDFSDINNSLEIMHCG